MVNGGWDYKVLSWNWHALVHAGLPGWETLDTKEAHSIFFTFTRKEGDVASREIASEWDDLARHDFYYRDWTDGSPFVPEGETYWSTFSFKRKSEAERFREKYGGKANWEPGWQEHLDSIFKRNF